MSLNDLLFKSNTRLNKEELDKRMRAIHDRLSELEQFAPDWQAEVNALRTVGLDRINTALLPAYQSIIDLADLGALWTASSETEVEIGTGQKAFTLPDPDRQRFAPPVYTLIAAGDDFANAMTARLVSYDRELGELVVDVQSFVGSGTFSDWTIGPIATSDDLETLRAETLAYRNTASDHATTAATKAGEANTSATNALGYLQSFRARYLSPATEDPSVDDNGDPVNDGEIYLNTVSGVLRVYSSVNGWQDVGSSADVRHATVTTDGTAGPYTLPAVPLSKYTVFGNVNGNALLWDDYEVAGDELTFNYTPPPGLTVDFAVLGAVEIGVPSAGTVGFAQVSQDVSELALIRQALTASGEKPVRWNHAWNPFMRLNTRGQASYSANGYTLDRWISNRSGGVATVTSEVLTRGEDGMPFEILLYLQYDVTTGDDNCRLEQRWPSARQFAGKTITVVFLSRGVNPGGGSILVSADQYFGAASATIARFAVDSEAVVLNATWTLNKIKLDIPDIDGVDLQNDSYFSVRLGQSADTSTDAWRLNMTGFMVFEGDVRDEFTELSDVTRHYRGDDFEKARCNVFCRMIEGYALQGTVTAAGSARFNAAFEPMNRNPDVTLATSGAISVYSNGFRTFDPPSIGSIGARTSSLTLIMSGTSGMTTNQSAVCVHNGNVLLLDAEV